MVLLFGFDAIVADAVVYAATPSSMNAASSIRRTDTAEIPRAALGPDALAIILHPLNKSSCDFVFFTNMDSLFLSDFGSGE